MLDYGAAQRIDIDALHREHQRRRLHTSVRIALAALDTGTESHVAVARAVYDRMREYCLAPRLRLDYHAAYVAAALDDIDGHGIHQHLDSGTLHSGQRLALGLLGIDDRQADMQLAGYVFARSPLVPKTADETFGRTLDYRVALAAEKAQHRQTYREIAAQKSAVLDKHRAGAALGGFGSHDAGRASAHHQHIDFASYGYLARRLRYGFDFRHVECIYYRLHNKSINKTTKRQTKRKEIKIFSMSIRNTATLSRIIRRNSAPINGTERFTVRAVRFPMFGLVLSACIYAKDFSLAYRK